jgi:hypothetical protein
MTLGERRHPDAEVPHLMDETHELLRVVEPLLVRLPGGGGSARRVTAQREDVADARILEVRDDLAYLVPSGAGAGEVGDRGDGRLLGDALHDAQGAVTGGPAGSIGDVDERRAEGLELTDGLPQRHLTLVGLRWEELEREGRAPGGEQVANEGLHRWNLRTTRSSGETSAETTSRERRSEGVQKTRHVAVVVVQVR